MGTEESASAVAASGGAPGVIGLEGKRVLVTGANRGIGEEFVEAVLDRGADRVYGAVRDPGSLVAAVGRHGDRLVPVELDLSVPATIHALPTSCPDVDLVIANAGQTCITPLVGPPDLTPFRDVFEANFFGPLELTRVFAPMLVARRGGLLYVNSIAGLICSRSSPGYSASKAANMMLAQGIRAQFKGDGLVVTSSYPGWVATGMSAKSSMIKASPRQIADRSLDGWLRGEAAVFPDFYAELGEQALLTNMARVLSDPSAVLTEMVATFSADPRAGH